MTSVAEPVLETARPTPPRSLGDRFVGRRYLQLVVVLGALMAIGPLTIDTYLPAFTGIATSLGATPVQMQQTLSAYLFGFAVMNLFHGALADSFGADRFDLVGHDWGGVIAWATAARHPGRIGRLVVLDAPNPDLLGRALRHPTQALRSSYAALFQLPLLPEALLSPLGFAGLRAMMRGSARSDTFRPGDLDRYATAWARPGRLGAMLNYYRSLRRCRRPAEPARIRPPTLVLWGERDAALERHVARDAVGLCDDGRLLVLPGTTHWLHLEEPGRVTAEILGFLKGSS